MKNWVVQELVSLDVEFDGQVPDTSDDGVRSHPASSKLVGWLVSFHRREDVVRLEVQLVAGLVGHASARLVGLFWPPRLGLPRWRRELLALPLAAVRGSHRVCRCLAVRLQQGA